MLKKCSIQPQSLHMPEIAHSHLLERYRLFDTNSRDVIRDVLVERFGVGAFDILRCAQGERSIGGLIRLHEIDLRYFSFPGTIKATVPATGFYRQQFAICGTGFTRVGTKQIAVDLNSTGVVPCDADAVYESGPALSHVMFRVSDNALRRRLSALTGHPASRALQFATSDDFSNPRQLRFRRLINVFISELDDDSDMSKSARDEFSDLLIVKFLIANRHNFSHMLEGEPSSAAPYQVRIIEEFIEANWDRPVTIEELGRQTGVGIRTMFATFKRARGYTPMSFLRLVRLQRAKQMLESPVETTSVLTVSLKCGFQNAGHFARYYRQAFGESPSTTLSAARLN